MNDARRMGIIDEDLGIEVRELKKHESATFMLLRFSDFYPSNRNAIQAFLMSAWMSEDLCAKLLYCFRRISDV